MKKEELRIGNLVYDSLRNKEVKIQLKHFRELAISEKVFFERYKAIELTEDKLLSFGFFVYNKTMCPNRFTKGIFELEKFNNCFRLEGINRVVKLKYTHQLQNLYYSLKNEELPIA